MRQIVLDTETTGLNPAEGHRIIEIGAIELDNRRHTGKHFHEYLNPDREIEAGALAVHGLSNDFLSDKPRFHDVVDAFLHFIEGAELIIHNAPFDVGFLDAELARLKGRRRKIADVAQILDSLVLARQKHMGQRNSLDALCKRYGIDNTNRQFHGALLDAELLADVYLAMTGGQVSLFGAMEEKETQASGNLIQDAVLLEDTLKVIRATPDELAAHQRKMAEIADHIKS